ncbi:ThiF family adenylyltransferase [Colwellia sp. MB02u-6]|uniref:ThiF family adenylyltransferase n=1 Tax=Colwellia sp. MB02u-6 TaxID=2759824 RepID=UPI0015F47670|nr:ThiF family adenylyltransferase [Colwellia sp. MB02u-6]MBA6328705.1 ThiF family adenylyltransferase [Colwellia sp. MB02u-6]
MFDYNKAFSRNVGWVTEEEQQQLRHKKIAIAGMGGVGGAHLITLARLGVNNFNISDFDSFEVHNFNRQSGAFMSTLGQQKSDVMEGIAKDINPNIDIQVFPEGVFSHNVDEFLSGVDIYVDALDFFALEARKTVFQKCYENSIPVITAAPLGMGCAFLCFMPGKMSYEQYFRFDDKDTENDQLIQFLIGLSPAMLQRSYLVDESRVSFIEKRGPSTPMAINLCAGIAETYVLKILLNRGPVLAAPWGLHFDAYRNKFAKTWRPFGNAGILPRLMFKIAKKIVMRPTINIKIETELKPIEQIFEYAKWSPSGDNMQPLRIEVLDEHSCIIHGHDTRKDVVYDLKGNASKLALGCFLENAKIAAQSLNFEICCSQISNKNGFEPDQENYDLFPTFKLAIQASKTSLSTHALFPYIKTRCVQRKRMGTRPLSTTEKQKLAAILPEGYSVIWKESFAERWRVAKLMYGNATTRLSMEEGFNVHSKIVEFTPIEQDTSLEKNCNSTFSKDKLPAKSLGIDPLTIALSRWSLKSWSRFHFLDKYLAGTVAPKLLLDFSTAIKSSAHFVIIADKEPSGLASYLEAGAAVQKFWLQATALQLGFQPEQTPVIFSEYLRTDVKFTENKKARENAIKMDHCFKSLIGESNASRAIFAGRVGRSSLPTSRSVRLSLEELRYVKDSQ